VTVAARPRKATRKPKPDRRLINRELSFLDYDARMLELASDSDLPLLERVRFCSIFSQMLDEFFMLRLGVLSSQANAGIGIRSPDGRTPLQTLREVRSRVLELQAKQARMWSDELVPALAAEGVVIAGLDGLPHSDLAELELRHARDIYPVLTPLAVGPGQAFPYISGLSLSLGAFVLDADTEEERFARVKVPERLPRYFPVGDGTRLVPLEQLIAHFLPTLFPGMRVLERSLFRLTRDADFDVSGDAENLLAAVELELRRRRFGEVTRLEISSTMSEEMRERIQGGLGVDDDLVYRIDGMFDLADASELADLDRPDLKVDAWVPVARPPLGTVLGRDQFAAIRTAPRLVHYPYDSFATSFESFVNTAATDPDVVALKSTVYRTGERTPLAPALIQAAESGKQTVCLVEIKARGDELRNIEWGRTLEQAGVHVVYGLPTMKVHAKATLIVRREAGGLRRYVHIGTGNYNHLTAKAYEDFGLFIADDDTAADVAELFNYITGFGRPVRFRKLLVAPFTLRERLVEEIQAVAEAGRKGQKARIRIKVNGLTDTAMIEELYAASQAGATIDLVVRGVCSLRPGVPGLSKGIRVRSVLGRFLEHSRLFNFEAGKHSTFYLGSADLMPRNLDHRIEVVTPVEDVASQAEIVAAFDVLLDDSASSWELTNDALWQRVRSKKDGKPRSAQAVLMRRARRRFAAARSH
jgi:polyphosphate kinase